jgi:hypothetical protein
MPALKAEMRVVPVPLTGKPGVIVCERKGTWAASLRHHLPRELRLRETRSLTECLAELAAAPASLAVVELSEANHARALDMVAEVGRRFPLALVVTVAPRGWEAWQWLAREAGAAHFTTSPRDGDLVARLAVRHAARLPTPATTLSARIWDSLPWSEAATH